MGPRVNAVEESNVAEKEMAEDFKPAVKVMASGWRSLDEIEKAYTIRMSEAERWLPPRPVFAFSIHAITSKSTSFVKEFDVRRVLSVVAGVFVALYMCSWVEHFFGEQIGAWAGSQWETLMANAHLTAAKGAIDSPEVSNFLALLVSSFVNVDNLHFVASAMCLWAVLWSMLGTGGMDAKVVLVTDALPLSINLKLYQWIRALTYSLGEYYSSRKLYLAADIARALRQPLSQMLCATLWVAFFVLLLNLIPSYFSFHYEGPLAPLRYMDLNSDGVITGAEMQHAMLVVCRKVLMAIIAAIAGGFALGIEEEVVGRVFPKEERTVALQSEIDFASSLFQVFVYSIVLLTTLDALGFPTGTLLAFGGVSGVAIGFGAQNTMTNFFSGVTILLNSRFRAGDYVRLNGGVITGTVEKIGWFSTHVVDNEGFRVTISNKDVADTPMVNISQRAYWSVSAGYAIECSHDRIQPIMDAITKVAKEYPLADKDPGSLVWSRCWYDGTTAPQNEMPRHKFSFWLGLPGEVERVDFHAAKSEVLLLVADTIVENGGRLVACDASSSGLISESEVAAANGKEVPSSTSA